MADVEKLAALLSQSRWWFPSFSFLIHFYLFIHFIFYFSMTSKTVGDLKTQYPGLEERIKSVLTYQMDRLVEEERYILNHGPRPQPKNQIRSVK